MMLTADRFAHLRGRMALAAFALALAGCGHMMHGRHGHAAGMAGHDGAMSGCCCMAGAQGMQHGGMAQSQAAATAAAGTQAAPGQGAGRLLPQQMAAAGPMCGSGGSSCCGCCAGMGSGAMGGGSPGPSGGGMGGGAGTAK